MMKKTRLSITTASCRQQALLIRREAVQPKRLLLIHGAGVGGETTWAFVAHYLLQWDEILIPDLAGMGNASFLHTTAPELDDYVQQIHELLAVDELGWSDMKFDVAGYSFGGMVTERLLRNSAFQGLCFLLEPAMLFSSNCEQVRQKGMDYERIANEILAVPDATSPYLHFLDLVSPKRERADKSESLILVRLKHNPRGFALALKAINHALQQDCHYYANWHSPCAGASFVGGLSWPVMLERHERLQKESHSWHFETVANADHSLVFTKPRSIATVMDAIKSRQSVQDSVLQPAL